MKPLKTIFIVSIFAVLTVLIQIAPLNNQQTILTSVISSDIKPQKAPLDKANPNCHANKKEAFVGETLFFTANLKDTNYQSYTWFFGDDSNIYRLNTKKNHTTEYSYKNPGIYQVDLLMSGTRIADLCSFDILIHELPSKLLNTQSETLIARKGAACVDQLDNDQDGLIDLQDIGCHYNRGLSEDNPLEKILPAGEPYQSFCLEKDPNAEIADFSSYHSADLLKDFLQTTYQNTPLINIKNPHHPLNRKEALSLIAKTTCIIKDRQYQLPISQNHKQPLITRGEFLKILIEIDQHLNQNKIHECQASPTKDVTQLDWHCRYINTALENQYIHLLDDDKIYPNLPITIETALIWLNNYISVINSPSF